MKVKSLLSALAIVAITIVASCSQGRTTTDSAPEISNFEEQEIVEFDGTKFKIKVPTGPLRTLVDEHVVFEDDNQFHITMSKDEALESGVTESEYDQLCNSVETSNKYIAKEIEEALSNPEVKSYEIQGRKIK